MAGVPLQREMLAQSLADNIPRLRKNNSYGLMSGGLNEPSSTTVTVHNDGSAFHVYPGSIWGHSVPVTSHPYDASKGSKKMAGLDAARSALAVHEQRVATPFNDRRITEPEGRRMTPNEQVQAANNTARAGGSGGDQSRAVRRRVVE